MFRPGDGADLASTWHRSPTVEAVEQINATHATNEVRERVIAALGALTTERELVRRLHAMIKVLKKQW